MLDPWFLSPRGALLLERPELAAGTTVLCGFADPTQEGRPSEDRALVWSGGKRTVLAVADGAGGHASAGRAAELAVEAVAASITDDDAPDALRHAVLDAFDVANRRVADLGVGAATTLAVAVLDGPRLRALHCGDSTVLVVGGRGAVRLATIAHSPVGYAVEAGWLDDDEALLHEERHLVSNMLGNPEMRVEVHTPIRLRPRDTVLLATDGVFDNLQVEEVAELVRKGPLPAAARALADACRARMLSPRDGQPSKPDDTTFVLYRCGSAGKAAT